MTFGPSAVARTALTTRAPPLPPTFLQIADRLGRSLVVEHLGVALDGSVIGPVQGGDARRVR